MVSPTEPRILFQPLKLGDVDIPNRIVMSPLTRARANEDNTVTEIMKEYYTQRANAGLIISEGTCVSQQGMGWHKAPGIWREDQVAGWKGIVEAVHAAGGKIACQLWHLGRQTHSEVTGQAIVSASEEALEGKVNGKHSEKKDPETPHALTEEEVEQVVEDWGKAAENAMDAGFDMVEVHGANGYLLDQFLQSKTNKRKDKYGGSAENRARFVLEIVDRITKSLPAGKVGIRLSPNGVFGEMGSADNTEVFDLVIAELAKRKIAFIEVMGTGFGFSKLHPEYTAVMARGIVKANGVDETTVVMSNVGHTAESAEEMLKSGDAAVVSFGRLYISNPDLAIRFRDGLKLNPDSEYADWWTSAKGASGYIDFPTYEEMRAKEKASA